MKRTIILHGWGSRPEDGWRPWLRRELIARGFSVAIPDLPDTKHPEMSKWVNMLADEIGTPDDATFLIGHSLGCITILRYLETLKYDERIGGAVLVSGFCEVLGTGFEEIEHFVQDPVRWADVLARCPNFRIIHGRDDNVVPLPFAERLSDHLGVPLHIIPGKHLGQSEGLLTLPPVLDAVLSLTA